MAPILTRPAACLALLGAVFLGSAVAFNTAGLNCIVYTGDGGGVLNGFKKHSWTCRVIDAPWNRWIEDDVAGTAQATALMECDRPGFGPDPNDLWNVTYTFSGYTTTAPPGLPVLIQPGVNISAFWYYTGFSVTFVGLAGNTGALVTGVANGNSRPQVGVGASGKDPIHLGVEVDIAWTAISQPSSGNTSLSIDVTGTIDSQFTFNCTAPATSSTGTTSTGTTSTGTTSTGTTSTATSSTGTTSTGTTSTGTTSTGTTSTGFSLVSGPGTTAVAPPGPPPPPPPPPCVSQCVTWTGLGGGVLNGFKFPRWTCRIIDSPVDRWIEDDVAGTAVATGFLECDRPGFGPDPNDLWNMTLVFTGYTTTPPPGLPKYIKDPAADISTFWYYTGFTGTLIGLGGNVGAKVTLVLYMVTGAQVGLGASGKDWFHTGVEVNTGWTVVSQPASGNASLFIPGTGEIDIQFSFNCTGPCATTAAPSIAPLLLDNVDASVAAGGPNVVATKGASASNAVIGTVVATIVAVVAAVAIVAVVVVMRRRARLSPAPGKVDMPFDAEAEAEVVVMN